MKLPAGGRVRLAAAAALAWLAAAGAGAQMLEIEGRATASGSRILLQDVVRSGTVLPEGWGERVIADAPAPRETRELSLTDIARALNNYDDMGRVVLRGKPTVVVGVRHRPLDVERIQQAIDDHAAARAEWRERRFEVATDKSVLPNVPHGELRVEVLELRAGTEYGRGTADVRLIVDGVPFGSGPMKVDLLEMRPFWAAARPLARGEAIAPEKLERRWAAERDGARHYSTDHSLDGLTGRRGVQAGQLLAAGMLDEPVFAKRGEIVRVISQRGGLTVTLRARALADGRRDERILCVNEQSGKRMNVRMVRPRRAVLEEEMGDMASLGDFAS